MDFKIKSFYQLTTDQLYAILRLRSAVFVVEQDCVYQDIDAKDQKALHVFTTKNKQVIAYARIFNKGAYFKNASIGRVIVSEEYRKSGLGHALMKAAIQVIFDIYKTTTIQISAQTHLKPFYQSHDFKQIGKGYLEDGIPHIAMQKN